MTAPTYVQAAYSNGPAAAYPGMMTRVDIAEGRIQGEATASIPFGYVVCRHATDVTKAILPAAETDVALGIVARSQEYDPSSNYDNTTTPPGIKPGYNMNVVTKGRGWVVAEDAVVMGARGWVRCTTAGAAYAGLLRSADSGTATIDSGAAVMWLSTVDAGALVEIEFDFTRKP
jgi:hypothetical protein